LPDPGQFPDLIPEHVSAMGDVGRPNHKRVCDLACEKELDNDCQAKLASGEISKVDK